MITYIQGNLFISTAQTLVNTVNTVGVMGKGIARDFKQFYPEMFEEYKQYCDEGTLEIGSLLLYRTTHKWVLNFPTKRHWKQTSKLSDIELGLETFQRTFAEQGITSIAFPQLGCGHGGLDWESQVRPLMERYLGELPIDVLVYVFPDSSDEAGVTRAQIARWLTEIPTPMRYAEFRDDVLSLSPPNGTATGGVDTLDETSASYERLAKPDDEPEGLFDLWRQLRVTGYLLPEDVGIALGIPAEPFFAHLTRLPYVERANMVRLSSISSDDGSTDSLIGLPAARGVQFVPPLAAGQASPQAQIDDEGALACSANPTQAPFHVSINDRHISRTDSLTPVDGGPALLLYPVAQMSL